MTTNVQLEQKTRFKCHIHLETQLEFPITNIYKKFTTKTTIKLNVKIHSPLNKHKATSVIFLSSTSLDIGLR